MHIAILLGVCLASGMQALLAWEAGGTRRLQAHGVEHVSAVFVQEDKALTCEVKATLFDSRTHDIRVLDDPGNIHGSLAAAASVSNWVAGVNGGYFHPDNRPLGLVVADSKVLHQQETSRLLSGILAATDSKIFLLRPAEFRLGPGTRQALQAGPFLVDQSRVVPGLEATRRARRTFVANNGGSLWLIGTISPLTLAEAGRLLASSAFSADVLHVHRALNLDGGSSSSYFFQPETGPPVYLSSLTRVRNYLGIVPRKEHRTLRAIPASGLSTRASEPAPTPSNTPHEKLPG